MRQRQSCSPARKLMAFFFALALFACTQPDPDSRSECIPTTPVSVVPPGDSNRRFEDIIEYLTGERQVDDVPVEEKIDDPNFGGVWGDLEGGIVVAVLDCSKVDANRLAEMAGGSDRIHLIEVPYTFKRVDEFRNDLVAQLDELGVDGNVIIHSTLEGRMIEVRVEDRDSLPTSFGAGTPSDIYHVVEGSLFKEG